MVETRSPDMEENSIISLTDVGKVYRSYQSPQHRLLELITGGRKRYAREKHALSQINFKLQRGDRLGIVGENGSGKSTLLKLLAGVLTPTEGTVKVRGRVSALLELGAGFNPELSGRENLRQYCEIHGMSRHEIEEATTPIVEFSELREAIAYPVKTYSSGMAVRLGFACAVYVKPDILIVDEALSVGDAYFQNKCLHKIRSMLDSGVTFIYVTHAADSIRSLCEHAVWLENGRIRLKGSATEVGSAYQREVFSRLIRSGLSPDTGSSNGDSAALGNNPESRLKGDSGDPRSSSSTAPGARGELQDVDLISQRAFTARVAPLRTGSGEIRIDDIVLVDSQGRPTDQLPFLGHARVRVFFHAERRFEPQASLTLGITDINGNQLVHFNSSTAGCFANAQPDHVQHMCEFSFDLPLCPGEYGLIAGIGVLLPHPVQNGRFTIDQLVDYCAGGARFSVLYSEDGRNRDLWGAVYVDYKVRQLKLD